MNLIIVKNNIPFTNNQSSLYSYQVKMIADELIERGLQDKIYKIRTYTDKINVDDNRVYEFEFKIGYTTYKLREWK